MGRRRTEARLETVCFTVAFEDTPITDAMVAIKMTLSCRVEGNVRWRKSNLRFFITANQARRCNETVCTIDCRAVVPNTHTLQNFQKPFLAPLTIRDSFDVLMVFTAKNWLDFYCRVFAGFLSSKRCLVPQQQPPGSSETELVFTRTNDPPGGR